MKRFINKPALALKNSELFTLDTKPLTTNNLDLNGMTLQNLLPPKKVLQTLYDKKMLTLPPSEQVKLVQMSIQEFKKTKGQSELPQEMFMDLSKGNVKNLTILGTVLSRHDPKGVPIAFKLLKLAMDKGDLDAGFRYSQLLSVGFPGCQPNIKEAIDILEQLASKGHSVSQYALGLRLINNKEDVEKGLKLIHQAADANMIHACTQLGHLYGKGILVEKDVKKAIHYLQIAAKKEHLEAMFLLGTHYYNGDVSDGNPDYAKGVDCYLAAANGGLAVAQHNLGSILFEGIKRSDGASDVPEKSLWKAVEYWKLAAEQGFGLSCINLGKLYMEGYPADEQVRKTLSPIARVDVNYSQARKYFEKALETDMKDEASLAIAKLEQIENIEPKKKDHCLLL